MGKISISSVREVKPNGIYRLGVYGVTGIGKSTFAADAPAPIFIGREQDVQQVAGVRLLPNIENGADLLEAVDVLTTEPHEFRTLVLDDLGVVNAWLTDKVLADTHWENLDAPGYGKGPNALHDAWRVLIARIERLQARRGMSVIMLGHSEVRKHEDPVAATAFDRFALSALPPKVAGFLSGWFDALLFARYDLATARDAAKKIRATSDGSRWLYTGWTAGYEAKNRFNLPHRIPLSWSAFVEAVEKRQSVDPAALKDEIADIVLALGDAVDPGKVQAELAKCAGNPARLALVADALRGKLEQVQSKKQQHAQQAQQGA